jgi:Na+-driven multidrug efflux pump
MVGVLTPVLLFARTIMRQFTDNQEVAAIGMSYLYIEAVTFYSYVMLHQSNSVLQGLKKPAMILWVGLYRQIPAPYLVFSLFTGPLALGVRGIWWGLAAVNWSAALFIFWYTIRQLRRASEASMTAANPEVSPV